MEKTLSNGSGGWKTEAPGKVFSIQDNASSPCNLLRWTGPPIACISIEAFFPQVKFALEAPKGGEMFECKSKAEARMMAIPMFDITELLANGNSFEADQSHTSQKGTIQADG